jgi:hypothetical protein
MSFKAPITSCGSSTRLLVSQQEAFFILIKKKEVHSIFGHYSYHWSRQVNNIILLVNA